MFDYVDLDNFGDYGYQFQNCRFYRGQWRAGAIGFDWNTSKPGEYQSIYRNCHFEDIKLTKTSIRDPIFIDCAFVFKKLSGVNFGCSGFVNCRFEGVFRDLTFRGAYSLEQDQLRKGKPPHAGFRNVSFAQADLHWIDLRDRFPLQGVGMPLDGTAFIASRQRLCADEEKLIARFPAPEAQALIRLYLKITGFGIKTKPYVIVAKRDLVKEGNEHHAEAVFAYLKECYQLAI